MRGSAALVSLGLGSPETAPAWCWCCWGVLGEPPIVAEDSCGEAWMEGAAQDCKVRRRWGSSLQCRRAPQGSPGRQRHGKFWN